MNDLEPGSALQVPAPDVTPPPQPEPPPGKIFRMPRFFPGVRVRLAGHEETISHIVISRQLVCVHLIGRENPVRPDQLELEPTVFTTARKPEPALT